MFGQMRSSRRGNYKPKPCPCKGVCLCHQPSNYDDAFVPILCLVGLLGIAISFICIVSNKSHNMIRHIDVRGEACEIHWIQTGISSTGAARGYDTVICPSWKK